jgi:eukaryotic-like serine/threonine-protein kinase
VSGGEISRFLTSVSASGSSQRSLPPQPLRRYTTVFGLAPPARAQRRVPDNEPPSSLPPESAPPPANAGAENPIAESPPGGLAPPTTEAELAARVRHVLGPTFELDREIGRGGMGIVYCAMDRRLKRQVAVKVLPPDLAFRTEIRTRFLHEAETAAQLTHPNIVPIFSVDERDGLVFFVMAFIDGPTLAQRIKTVGGALPVEEARRMLREVGSALAYAHLHGVIHRDIKPDNILLTTDGARVMVTDFGIARAVTAGMDSRLTATGVAIGTPAYMSPEQCAGDKEVDGRSDLYSLGVVGYQMLSGVLPFSGSSTAALLVKQLSEAPTPLSQRAPTVPPGLSATVMRLLAKNPDQRFPDANAFLRALDAPLTDAAASAAAPSSADASPRPFPLPASPQPATPHAPPGMPPYAPPHAAPMPFAYPNAGFPAPSPPAPLTRNDKRALKRGKKDQERIFDSDPRDVKIRKFRGMVVSLGGTMIFLSILSVVTSPHFFWAIFPDLGMGLALFKGAGKLWADGISMSEVFGPRRYDALTPPAMGSLSGMEPPTMGGATSPSAALLAPAAVLAGPHGGAVRRAALDRDRIHDLVRNLDRHDRGLVPNAEVTAKGLAEQVGAVASALHRIDVETPPDQRLALAERRQALAAQLDRASILLQTLYLDLVRLRVSNASSGADGVTGVTEQATALSRDIGYLLGAADEIRALDGSPRSSY